jgi:uncharacterized protein HemX
MATTTPSTPKTSPTKPSASKSSAAKASSSKVAGTAKAFDVRKTLTDAGYIAVGIGVLGVQQAQARRQKLIEQISVATDEITTRAKKRSSQLQSLPSKVSEQFSSIDPGARLDDVRARVESARERANEIGEQTRGRIAPVIDQFETRVNELPTPLPQAAAPVVKAAKQLLSA